MTEDRKTGTAEWAGPTYISLNSLARRTGLPRAWLKREAEADRIPNLRIGLRRLFDQAAVEHALASRQDRGTADAR